MVPWFIVKIAHTLNNGKNLYEKDKNWIHKVDYIHTKAEGYREPCQIPKMELFQTLTIFAKKPRIRCLTRFSIRFWKAFQLIFEQHGQARCRFVRNGKKNFCENPSKTYMRATFFTEYHLFLPSLFPVYQMLIFYSFWPPLKYMIFGNTNRISFFLIFVICDALLDFMCIVCPFP